MEWLIFLAVVAAAAVFVAWPRAGDSVTVQIDVQYLREERESILAELREVDDDALAGRITGDDRRESRRLLGVRLLRVTEALRDFGEEPSPRAPRAPRAELTR